MGNIIRMRRKVTEELDSLSQKMEAFRDDIERTAEAKRMILWYLTLSTFFLSSALIAYVWIAMPRKEQRVLYSILSFVAGQIILWVGRKMANAFYNWRITRKRQGLDSLIAKKKSLLETVKETETFKVAKEILDKYDEDIHKEEPVSSTSPGQPENSATKQQPSSKMSLTKNPNSSTFEATPKESPVIRPRVQPIRPYQRDGITFIDKLVDYFFGDGPSQRYALICVSCHGHNGMALPAEYDYLAFVCYICGHFNPARKFRPMKLPTLPPGSQVHPTPKTHSQMSFPSDRTDVQCLSNALLDSDGEPEKANGKQMKLDDSLDDSSEDHVEVLDSTSKS
ncbi:hypothetical protein KIN20_033956 [Parelaphostrongylus tenuis]|uniref:Endoplasmic reticulum junction formation protein lunapark n=1 Tax=Parelaphostrongylus tenuis TaxID=148309 RepID=A0AAD5WJB1_PARTN|nr:hypothetical protein KIN20_033956 [Parelaphostrongylus tenuis]